MKNSCVILEGPSTPLTRKMKNGPEKRNTPTNKHKPKKVTLYRYGLPPMAPHNTTQDIINSHPIVLFDEEELLGSYPSLLNPIS